MGVSLYTKLRLKQIQIITFYAQNTSHIAKEWHHVTTHWNIFQQKIWLLTQDSINSG